MSIFLAILAVFAGLVGVVVSSTVALGPSIVGYAVVLALLARLAQSHGHHRAWREAQRGTTPETPETPDDVMIREQM